MDSKEIIGQLAQLGLTETEARLYVAGLAAESVSVQELAKATGIKRPTIYHALGTLADKGLVALRQKGTKTRYAMSAPEHLAELLRKERERLAAREQTTMEKLIPGLASLARGGERAGVSAVHYEGVEGVKAVIDMAIYCKSKQWDIIAPIQNFLRDFDPAYAKHYLQAREYYGIVSRTLWERMPEGRRLTETERAQRNPRIIPESMRGTFSSMLVLFDDKIAIISSFEDPSAILITSKEAHALLSGMFEAIWRVAEPY